MQGPAGELLVADSEYWTLTSPRLMEAPGLGGPVVSELSS